ncbi:hypothetical protein [Tannerella forsythia]|uniref:hypothetical protein n=1 Tax=Tannerella forsythia TaxID=28112 RepID=UPI0021AB5682|nr:hypothetical protein [Tannerella forsythia]
MKRLYLNAPTISFFLLKSICIPLLLATGISCNKNNELPTPDDGIRIENLETRLRIVESYESYSDLWDANVENILIYAPPYYSAYRGDTCFGYTDEKGEVTLCKVKNLSASVKDWKAELVHDTGFGIIREINVRLSGIVQTQTDSSGYKHRTLVLTSIVPTGPKPKPTLRSGIYWATYPMGYKKDVKIEFIDKKEVVISTTASHFKSSDRYNYEILEDEHVIILKELAGKSELKPEHKLFFRMINDSEFDLDLLYDNVLEYPRYRISTFKKEE